MLWFGHVGGTSTQSGFKIVDKDITLSLIASTAATAADFNSIKKKKNQPFIRLIYILKL